jgi:hypothetical protein
MKRFFPGKPGIQTYAVSEHAQGINVRPPRSISSITVFPTKHDVTRAQVDGLNGARKIKNHRPIRDNKQNSIWKKHPEVGIENTIALTEEEMLTRLCKKYPKNRFYASLQRDARSKGLTRRQKEVVYENYVIKNKGGEQLILDTSVETALGRNLAKDTNDLLKAMDAIDEDILMLQILRGENPKDRYWGSLMAHVTKSKPLTPKQRRNIRRGFSKRQK